MHDFDTYRIMLHFCLDARATAQKFADDSDCRLGSIRNAQQGQFSISDRDANTLHIKNVKVVTTIEYSLE